MNDLNAVSFAQTEIAVNERMDKIYDVLDRAYGFLFETGRTNGNWNEVRSTSLAGMCIDRLPSDHPYWRRSVRSWLESEQLKDGATQGSWGEEIWDTSMALLSLKSLGAHNHDPNIQQGLDWIAGKYSLNGRGNWHDDPWETSWALIAIIASGKVPQNVDVLAPIKWLAALQDEEGQIISPQNTAYFAAICRDIPKVGANLDLGISDQASRAMKFLQSELQTSMPSRLWTNEAWSNGQILWILGERKLFPVEDMGLVDKTISWFYETQDPRHGSWEDVEDTASATLGLLSLLQGLITRIEGGRQAKEVLSNELQRRIRQSSLRVNVRLIEQDAESGGFLIRVSRRKLKIIGYILPAIATLAAIAGLWDFISTHWHA